MGKRVELPRLPAGTEKEQLQTLYSYLYQMAETLNNNLAEIGGAELTDSERVIVNGIIGDGTAEAMNEAESLKSLIIKTAEFVQSQLNEYRMHLLGEYVAEGKFGKYVRKTGLDVDVTPTGITQNYTFQEIIQDLKRYEVNAKNYIKTGLLRTVSSVPVYGVAIGKDVVTFSTDGTETYNDGNKVAELTADELSFWQNSVKIASYTGSKITFYYNGNDAFYIQNGKIYCNGDLEIMTGKKLKVGSGASIDINASGNLKLTGSTVEIKSGSTIDIDSNNFKINSTNRYMQCNNASFGQYGMSLVMPDTNLTHKIFAIGDYGSSSNSYPAISIYGYQAKSVSGVSQGLYASLENKGSYGDGKTGRFVVNYVSSSDNEDILRLTAQKVSSSGTVLSDGGGLIGGPLQKWKAAYIKTIEYTTLTQSSSKDIKHDIKDLLPDGEMIDGLRPVTFVYDDDAKERKRAGLIYEETMEILPEICTQDEGNKAINYVELIPYLLKEIQELRARVKALEEREGGN